MIPDTQAVLRGVETELIWHGCTTVGLTRHDYTFTAAGSLVSAGGPTSWVVRAGRVSVVNRHELRVELELDPGLLFKVPATIGTFLAIVPVDIWFRVTGMLVGAACWARSGFGAWRNFEEWIVRGARRPFFTPRVP